MHAKLGANPSFIWRSIWKTQAIMRSSISWRIGDEKTTNVWYDLWLPCNTSSSIQTKPLPHLHDITVSSLRELNGHDWD